MRRFAHRLIERWRVFWLWRAGYGFWGRIASRLASFGLRGYRQESGLAGMTPKGYIAADAEINVDLRLGSNVFVAKRAEISRISGEGFVDLHDGVQINQDCNLRILEGGSITIGEQVGLQKGCVLVAAVQPIIIRRRAEIAPYCAFFSYDHGTKPGREIHGQPLTSKGPIVVEEDAWLGTGVTVCSGVTIGRGAVVGAGSVVVRDIPENAIAAGAPARVIKYRGETPIADNPGKRHLPATMFE